ncbi:hypothetical protein SEA_GRETCHEN_5 [Microbacterium phage Gretchen]|uniref:Uncharacterized protein n=1 Tax=Microbacterium phage Percival TaxID=2201439 RepID=A0A2Z4Q850_9CAUD|nr:hypothetical protein PBI_PERCIVAL_5 [Microbacterium phage Percival]UDL14779.1 hypothetical protein SEA_GRETCHEN_5 [Microbacterium phage Gretchen]
MAERIWDDPEFIPVYTPPQWPTLPETGTAYVSRAWLPSLGTVGWFAYTPDALGFFAVRQDDEAAQGVHLIVDSELDRILSDGGTTRDARDAVLASALFDPEERMELADLYSAIREAWQLP